TIVPKNSAIASPSVPARAGVLPTVRLAMDAHSISVAEGTTANASCCYYATKVTYKIHTIRFVCRGALHAALGGRIACTPTILIIGPVPNGGSARLLSSSLHRAYRAGQRSFEAQTCGQRPSALPILVRCSRSQPPGRPGRQRPGRSSPPLLAAAQARQEYRPGIA